MDKRAYTASHNRLRIMASRAYMASQELMQEANSHRQPMVVYKGNLTASHRLTPLRRRPITSLPRPQLLQPHVKAGYRCLYSLAA